MSSRQLSVLLFYPHNFSRATSGTEKRFVELLEYFRSRNVPADVFTLSGFSGTWPESDLQRHAGLVRNIYLYQWPAPILHVWRTLLQRLSGKLPNYAISGLKREFKSVATRGEYTHVLISYAYWADLADGISGAVTLLDVLDILTFNFFHRSQSQQFRLGRMFESELARIGKFQAALTISPEETTLLRSICPRTLFYDVPASMPAQFQSCNDYSYDLIFVGSGNPFNAEGVAWFMSEVAPLLDASTRILVVGGVCGSITSAPSNVVTVPYVESLSHFYQESKIAICPLFGGSGLKIKVVEALAHGRPVVANDFGLAGLPEHAVRSGCIRANSARDFAAAIRCLLEDPHQYAREVDHAKRYFVRWFGRDNTWRALDRIFRAKPGHNPNDSYIP